jgi:hypothetical protein
VSAVVSLVKIVDLILSCSKLTIYSMYNVCNNFSLSSYSRGFGGQLNLLDTVHLDRSC